MPNASKMSSSEQTKQVLFFSARGKLKCCSLLQDAVDAEIFLESRRCGKLETVLGKHCFLLVLS